VWDNNAADTITINQCDVHPDQSGSPAYQEFGTGPSIRGVFSFSSSSGNGFVQLTSARFNDVVAWRNGESHSSVTASGQTGGQTARLATVYVLLQNSTPQLHLLALFAATLPSRDSCTECCDFKPPPPRLLSQEDSSQTGMKLVNPSIQFTTWTATTPPAPRHPSCLP